MRAKVFRKILAVILVSANVVLTPGFASAVPRKEENNGGGKSSTDLVGKKRKRDWKKSKKVWIIHTFFILFGGLHVNLHVNGLPAAALGPKISIIPYFWKFVKQKLQKKEKK